MQLTTVQHHIHYIQAASVAILAMICTLVGSLHAMKVNLLDMLALWGGGGVEPVILFVINNLDTFVLLSQIF